MTFALYCVYPALPYSSVRLPGANAVNRLVLAPQGWAFFTRSPREERQWVYGRDLDGWKRVMKGPHARLSNDLGLDRGSRAQGVEIAMLMSTAPSRAWQACEGAVPACLARLPRGTDVRNPSPNPTLCGTVAIVQREPVPWAWLNSPAPVQMPSRLLPLEVSC
jgi:antimicrobial peptide system SdpA family protein